jgi:hypothetical protein
VKRVCEVRPGYFFLAAFFFAGFFAFFFFAAIVFPPRNIRPLDHETTRTNKLSGRLARRDRTRQGSDGRIFDDATPDPRRAPDGSRRRDPILAAPCHGA